MYVATILHNICRTTCNIILKMSIHSCILNVCFRETREYSRVLLIADHHPIDPGRHPSNGDLADEVPSEQCVRVRGLQGEWKHLGSNR